MTVFYSVSHNSFGARGMPWVQDIVSGLDLVRICHTCADGGRQLYRPRGTVTVQLEKNKGTHWPDVLGCGAWPLFIVSRRVVDDWVADGLASLPAQPIEIIEPIPAKLAELGQPAYFWLDGHAMFGAKLDFEASGFVGVRFCPDCGTRMDDVSATYERQHSGEWPLAVRKETWSGADIFTTDLSPTSFFCTERVIEIAKRCAHKNLRFVPRMIAGSSHKGITYL